MFTKRSADLPAAQLARPILQPPQAFSPYLASFSSNSKVTKTLGPFDKKVSGPRLARQDRTCAFSIGRGSKNWPEPSKTQAKSRVPAGGSKAPAYPSCGSSLHIFTALAGLARQTPLQGRPGGSTWPSWGLNVAQHDPKIASPRDQLGFKFDFTDHSDFMD